VELQSIHCFLVHPAKGASEQPNLGGTPVPKHGKLFDRLNAIFGRVEEDCRTDIIFNPNPNGAQQNDCRDLFLAYFASHTVHHRNRPN